MLKKKSIIILFIYCLLLILSCVPVPSVDNPINSIPDWLRNPPMDNAEYWFGTGEGEAIEESISRALSQIASKISVHVNSILKIRSDEKDTKLYSEIKIKPEDIHFPGYETIKTEYTHKVFVIVRVKKEKLFKLFKIEYLQLAKSLKDSYNDMKSKHVLEILKLKKEFDNQCKKVMAKANILHIYKYLPDYNPIDNKYFVYKNYIKSRLESPKIIIKHNNKQFEKDIADCIKELLTKENFQFIDSKTGNSDLTVLFIKGNNLIQEQFGNEFLVKISINISLKTINNRTISEKNYKLPGYSLIGFDSAIQNAIQTFHDDAKNEGILKYLGL